MHNSSPAQLHPRLVQQHYRVHSALECRPVFATSVRRAVGRAFLCLVKLSVVPGVRRQPLLFSRLLLPRPLEGTKHNLRFASVVRHRCCFRAKLSRPSCHYLFPRALACFRVAHHLSTLKRIDYAPLLLLPPPPWGLPTPQAPAGSFRVFFLGFVGHLSWVVPSLLRCRVVRAHLLAVRQGSCLRL